MSDLLIQLEQKVNHAVELIELLRFQVETIEEDNNLMKEENISLKAEHEQWRHRLSSLIKDLDRIDVSSSKKALEEEYLTA